MKKVAFLSILMLFAAFGCSEREEPAGKAAIELVAEGPKVVKLAPEGDIVELQFTSAKDWRVEVPADAEWLQVSPLAGTTGTGLVNVEAEANVTGQTRTAEIAICSENETLVFTVLQQAFVPVFELLETGTTIGSQGGTIVIGVRTNVEYKYEWADEWIKEDVSKAASVDELRFIVEPNPSGESRTAIITFCAEGTCKAFTVVQRAAGTSDEEWKDREFVHRSLAMRFTATWCGYCPQMADAFDLAADLLPTALEYVSFHGEGSNYEFSGTDVLKTRFNIPGYPTAIVDARAAVPNYTSTQVTAETVVAVAQETQDVYPAQSGIACSSRFSGMDLSVELSVYFKEAGAYSVTVLLLEDGIVGYQNQGGDNYVHDGVVRLAVTSVSGEPVKIEEGGGVWNKEYSVSLDSQWNKDNLRLLVYVEKPYGGKAKVSGVAYAEYENYGDTYIDNSLSAEVGTTVELELK